MKKLLGAAGVALTILLATSSPAVARDLTCNGVVTGGNYGDVVVPRDGACTLIRATVSGDVKASANAYLQTTGTRISGDVSGKNAQTVFVDTGSKVLGSVEALRTQQVFVFNSTVTRDIDVSRTRDVVQICGTNVLRGDISVEKSSTDILIGDPLTVDCAGNKVRRGDVLVRLNFALVEFVIRSNEIRKGDLEVFKNTGPVRKFVEDNTSGKRLKCRDNSRPLRVSRNSGWDQKQGQCA